MFYGGAVINGASNLLKTIVIAAIMAILAIPALALSDEEIRAHVDPVIHAFVVARLCPNLEVNRQLVEDHLIIAELQIADLERNQFRRQVLSAALAWNALVESDAGLVGTCVLGELAVGPDGHQFDGAIRRVGSLD